MCIRDRWWAPISKRWSRNEPFGHMDGRRSVVIVEVIVVGTELLLGQIVNTNGSHIGARIADLGLDAHYQQTVGDNLTRMVAAIELAISRADAVIITGGIGPTQDDITREAICEATGRPMAFSDEYAAALRARYAEWSREMPESNLRQAEHPEGAELLPNPRGTAPGIALEYEGTLIFAVPGVPAEMHMLLDRQVLPRIKEKAGIESVLVSRVIRTWGRGESSIAERLGDLFDASTNPSMAFLASSGEIKVRLTAKAPTVDEAEALIAPVQAEVVERLGPLVFGIDGEEIEEVVLGMAVGARECLDVDVALSVTGFAGPDAEGESPGTMVIAVATPEHSQARTFHLPGDRERVRAY